VCGRRLAFAGAVTEAGWVVDAELSGAVVAYIRGTDAAARLRPLLQQLVAEAVYWPVDWDLHDLDSASRLVQDGMASRHPELSDEAMAAIMWEFGYSYF
jgi:hypothetical protein